MKNTDVKVQSLTQYADKYLTGAQFQNKVQNDLLRKTNEKKRETLKKVDQGETSQVLVTEVEEVKAENSNQ